MKSDVLIIGSGGREHALGWKLQTSPLVGKLYFAPGNAGTSEVGENITLKELDFENIAKFVINNNISLTVVGPELPLVHGIVDYFNERGLPEQGHYIFGPTKLAAEIEGSKVFAKQFMQRHGIPTANFLATNDSNEAVSYLGRCSYPIVIKASGLAGGKGVLICEDKDSARTSILNLLIDKTLGDAANEIVIEEYLDGEEISILALSDGEVIKQLIPVQDHKKIFDGDKGPNTGGMGSYAPVPLVSKKKIDEIYDGILVPTIQGLKMEGRAFTGCLFAGIMMTSSGPKVLEFNCRFGDPETQPLVMLLENDLFDILMSCAAKNYTQKLSEITFSFSHDFACCVIMVSGGYPHSYVQEKQITGLRTLSNNSTIFHAGTKSEEGNILTNGGRVLGITSKAPRLKDAIEQAYECVDSVSFEGAFYRKDIGFRSLRYEEQI